MTVIMASTMSPKSANPARRATKPRLERDRPPELGDPSEDGEEAARMETSGVREVERTGVKTRSVKRPEELPGPVIDKEPGQHDPSGDECEVHGQRRWTAWRTRCAATSREGEFEEATSPFCHGARWFATSRSGWSLVAPGASRRVPVEWVPVESVPVDVVHLVAFHEALLSFPQEGYERNRHPDFR